METAPFCVTNGRRNYFLLNKSSLWSVVSITAIAWWWKWKGCLFIDPFEHYVIKQFSSWNLLESGARCSHISLMKEALVGYRSVLGSMLDGFGLEKRHGNSCCFERLDDKGVHGLRLVQDPSALKHQDRSMIREHSAPQTLGVCLNMNHSKKTEVNASAFHFPNRKSSQPTPLPTASAMPVWFPCGQSIS